MKSGNERHQEDANCVPILLLTRPAKLPFPISLLAISQLVQGANTFAMHLKFVCGSLVLNELRFFFKPAIKVADKLKKEFYYSFITLLFITLP